MACRPLAACVVRREFGNGLLAQPTGQRKTACMPKRACLSVLGRHGSRPLQFINLSFASCLGMSGPAIIIISEYDPMICGMLPIECSQ